MSDKIEVVAELSGNHGGDIKNAFLLIEAAKQAGADAVKLQCFDPDRLAARRTDNEAVRVAAGGKELVDLYKKTVTPREWFPRLKRLADDIGISIFSSVFDPCDIPFLIDTGFKRLKIASFEATDIDLIEACCWTDLPLVVSTSAWTSMARVMLALSVVKERGGMQRLTVLHATSYADRRINPYDLVRMNQLKVMLSNKVPVGLSDHSGGLWQLNEAKRVMALSPAMIEAHLCLPDIETLDSKFSYFPNELQVMVQNVRGQSHTGKHLQRQG